MEALSRAAGALLAVSAAAIAVATAGCGLGPSGLTRLIDSRPAPAVADAALVFGCNSDASGALSPCLMHRMRYAVELYRAGRFRKLVVSGGRTLPVWSSEARLMGNLARGEGVPSTAVVEEGRAQTTFDNLVLSAPLLRAMGARTVVLLSHRRHLPRIAGLARALGLDREFEIYYEPVR